ncbi:MAG: caspase family protein [Chloroflexota bacterium]|nr:caspase family protein [Chloroflexota bacterium]
MTDFDHGHALIVGVGADLPNTVDDAAGIAEILKDPARCAYPPDQVHTLTGERATRAAILSALDDLAESTNPESTLTVYFSGHGYQAASSTGEFYYLMPYGYDVNALYQTCISGAEFADRLRAIPAQKLLLLLDCCHAGGVGEAKAPGLQLAKSPLPPEAQGLLAEGSGRVLVASSQEDELSYAGKPYSAFTLALIESLCGAGVAKKDGYVRVADLALHARQMVPGRTKDRQHPVLHFEQADNFALAYYAGGETQPKGLPFTGEPEIEPEPGAWAGLVQRGQVNIAGGVSGQVAVGGEGPVIQFGDVSGGQVTIGEQATNRTPERTCRSCGHRLRPGARFCGRCGTRVGERP